MKTAIFEKDGELRFYVLCDGACGAPVGVTGVVVWDKRRPVVGPVEVKVYCMDDDPGGGLHRPLSQWLSQLSANTAFAGKLT